mgnify:CR=1 FL=1
MNNRDMKIYFDGSHYIGIPKNLLSDIEDISSWQKNLKYIFDEKERRIKENVKKK